MSMGSVSITGIGRRSASVVVAALVVFAACTSSGPSHARSFGHEGDRIIVTPGTSADAAMSRDAARDVLDHPFMSPAVVKPTVVYEGFGTVRVGSGEDMAGGGTGLNHKVVGPSSLDGHQVWIRVSKGIIGAHSCGGAPLQIPPGKVLVEPPAPKPIAFAVMVDARTGDEANWFESSTTPICPFLRDR